MKTRATRPIGAAPVQRSCAKRCAIVADVLGTALRPAVRPRAVRDHDLADTVQHELTHPIYWVNLALGQGTG
jgi:hypothetical protein